MVDEKFYINNGTLYKATVGYDYSYDNEDPRKEWDNYTHMNIYLRNFCFGDNECKGEREDDLLEFVRTHYDNNELISKALEGRFSTKYSYTKNKDDERDMVRAERTTEDFDYEIEVSDFVEDIYEELSFHDLWVLCQNHSDFIALPIYAYIHSGITISTGDYGDPWDSGWAGYIYVTRKDAEKNGVVWSKKEMIKILEDDVKVEDMWLNNQIYYINVEKYDIEYGWIDYESCGGFYSDEWGDELVRYIIKDLFGVKVNNLYDEDDDEVQEYYRRSEELEYATEKDRQNMLHNFTDTLAKLFDKYKISATDLRTIKEVIS